MCDGQGLAFADVDYGMYGFNSGWGQLPTAAGPPSDAAVKLSGALNVSLRGCRFSRLGGGGVHASNGTRGLSVRGGAFESLGQSGVVLTGNATSQPANVTVEASNFSDVGELLFSSAAVLVASASYVSVLENRIARSARWGVAFHDMSTGMGRHNAVERNTISDVGLSSATLGAISASGVDGALSHTLVRHNCVRRAVGLGNGASFPYLPVTPYYAYAVFLDNAASGYTITGNVLRDHERAAVRVHHGRFNVIENNVLFNTSNVEGDADAGQFEIAVHSSTANDPYNTTDNAFVRNVVVAVNRTTRAVIYGPKLTDGWREDALTPVDYNLYADPDVVLATWRDGLLTPLGSWHNWTSAYGGRYDPHSLIDVDPGFVDFKSNNFCFKSDSLALTALGFDALPTSVCSEC